MPKTINILTVIDAERVLRDHAPNGSQVVPLKNYGQGYAFSLTEWSDTDKYQGGDIFYKVPKHDQEEGGYALNVMADVGDTIRWRLIAMASPFQYQCYLYQLTNPDAWYNITPPQPKSSLVTRAAINPGSGTPYSLAAVQTQDFWWESQVTKARRQAYNLLFTIVDSAGVKRGQFSQDPYINAVSGS